MFHREPSEECKASQRCSMVPDVSSMLPAALCQLRKKPYFHVGKEASAHKPAWSQSGRLAGPGMGAQAAQHQACLSAPQPLPPVLKETNPTSPQGFTALVFGDAPASPGLVFTPGFQSPESILDFQLRLRAAMPTTRFFRRNFWQGSRSITSLCREAGCPTAPASPALPVPLSPAWQRAKGRIRLVVCACAARKPEPRNTVTSPGLGQGYHTETFFCVSRIAQGAPDKAQDRGGCGPKISESACASH